MIVPPDFHVLDRSDCEALIAPQPVGRLALNFRNRVDLEPVHYVCANGHIDGCTQYGTKVDVLAHHPWIAFEVDEMKGLCDWKSVVVHGRIEFPDPDGLPQEIARRTEAVKQVGMLIPLAFGAGDPTPVRELAFGIAVQEISGRAATSGGTD